MATRTSSPAASRSKSTPAKGGSTSRSRSTGKKTSSRRKPAPKKRPAPRAVRSGPSPVYRLFAALGGVIARVWLGAAHVVGSAVRRVGSSASELEPEHRRDGAGLFLAGLAVVVAAGVWWQLPGGFFDAVRGAVAGSVGLVAWFVPLLLVYVAWRNLRDPQHNGPAGRQAIGWAAFLFGVLGIVHIANGSPRPKLGDTGPLQQAGGALGFVVSKLLLDLLGSPAVAVALLVLLSLFGVLVITATPVYQVPTRLAALRDQMLGRTVPEQASAEEDTTALRRSGRSRRRVGTMADRDIDPEMGDPAYDTPVIEGRGHTKRGLDKLDHRGDKLDHRGDKLDHRGDKLDHRGDKLDHRGDKLRPQGDQLDHRRDELRKRGAELQPPPHDPRPAPAEPLKHAGGI